MHKLDLYYNRKSFFGSEVRKHVHLEPAESWDELTRDQLELIVSLHFNDELSEETKKTLLLQKLCGMDVGLFNALTYIQVISIYDFLDVFFEAPQLTVNLYPVLRKRMGWKRMKLIGPANAFGNLTVSEFIAAEDYYFDYLTEGYKEESLDGLIATLWRDPVPGLDTHSPEYGGDLRVPFNIHQVADRVDMIERLPSIWKMGMLYWYQGCRSLLTQLYDHLFASSGEKGEINSEVWLEMLKCLDNAKFGTIKEIGPMNLLTVFYFSNKIIAHQKIAKHGR